MKEFYIDKNGQKRRLRISAGDIVICDNDGELLPYMVTASQDDNAKFGLICLLCSRPVASTTFSKKELQGLLYGFGVYDVIKRKQFRNSLVKRYPKQKISNCLSYESAKRK